MTRILRQRTTLSKRARLLDAPDTKIVACTLAQTRERQFVPFTARGLALLVVRDGDRLYACERACPHEYIDLRQGRCAGGRLHCPRHRASFDLATGAVSPGWDFPNLRMFPVEIRGDEVIVDLRFDASAMSINGCEASGRVGRHKDRDG